MFKKIIAFALSSLMLAQSVSAANLYDFVNDSSKVPSQVITNNLFDYGSFRTIHILFYKRGVQVAGA